MRKRVTSTEAPVNGSFNTARRAGRRSRARLAPSTSFAFTAETSTSAESPESDSTCNLSFAQLEKPYSRAMIRCAFARILALPFRTRALAFFFRCARSGRAGASEPSSWRCAPRIYLFSSDTQRRYVR